jgi:hypothetical protein
MAMARYSNNRFMSRKAEQRSGLLIPTGKAAARFSKKIASSSGKLRSQLQPRIP